MRGTAFGSAILTLCVCRGALAATLPWALEFESRPDHEFLYDARVVRLISTDLGITPGTRAMRAFHGVPAPLSVVDHRYVWTSSCEAHKCPFNRGFFWLDSGSGESLAAQVAVSFPRDEAYRKSGVLTEHTVLTVGGSAASAKAIPPEALEAMRLWILAEALRFDAVYYRSVNGSEHPRMTALVASEYSAPP